MASWRETFLALPIDARRAYAKRCCRKGLKARVGALPPLSSASAPKQSKQEMLDFAKRHQVITKDEMYVAMHDFRHENPPTMAQLEYMFGSWDAFREEIENDPASWSWGGRIGDEELAQYCSMLKIKSAEHYCELRKTTVGETLPPFDQIEKRFGSWMCFHTLALSYSIDKHMDAYFRESIRAGRALKVYECDNLGIEIRYLMECTTPALFKKLMSEREKLYRKNNPDSYLKGKK